MAPRGQASPADRHAQGRQPGWLRVARVDEDAAPERQAGDADLQVGTPIRTVQPPCSGGGSRASVADQSATSAELLARAERLLPYARKLPEAAICGRFSVATVCRLALATGLDVLEARLLPPELRGPTTPSSPTRSQDPESP